MILFCDVRRSRLLSSFPVELSLAKKMVLRDREYRRLVDEVNFVAESLGRAM